MARVSKLLILIFAIFLFNDIAIAKESSSKKIRPAVDSKEKKDEKKSKKAIKPAGIETKVIKLEDVSKIINDDATSYLEQYKSILREEIKPKSEFETEEEYKKRLEGASKEMTIKKIQVMEDIYKKKRYYSVKEIPITLPQYNPEEQFFDIKVITLPLIENVIYQPPEEQTNLRFVPSENGVDLYLKLKIPPDKGKVLRDKDKFIKADVLFTTYLSLKSQEDLNVFCVVAFSDVIVYIKEKESTSDIYKQSLRINTPTFPKRE